MKSVYPDAGKLYGKLSDYSHFDAKLHSLFYSEKDGELAVRGADRGTKFMAMHWPFELFDVALVVFEERYLGRLPKLLALKKNGGLKKSRFTISNKSKYFQDVGKEEIDGMFA